jgi:thymidine phosphorylase
MKTLDDARTLAQSMVAVGQAHGMQIRALITRMDAPLGWAIGNALEIMESVEILRGEHSDSELAQMSFRLAAEMLIMGGAAQTLDEAQAKVQASIQDGSALDTLRRFVTLNGGDAKALDDFSRLPQPGQVVEIRADRAGYISAIDGRALGLLAMDLGAGRKNRDDVLDLGVGIRVHVTVGSIIEKSVLLFTVYAKLGCQVPFDALLATLRLAPGAPSSNHWLLETIGC